MLYDSNMEDLSGNNAISQALDQIMVIRGEVYSMGANEAEIPDIDSIIDRLKSGKLAPEKALEEAHAIQARKMDTF